MASFVGLSAPRLSFNKCTFQWLELKRVKIDDVQMGDAEIEGSVELSGQVGRLYLRDASLGRHMQIGSAIVGFADLNDARSSGSVRIEYSTLREMEAVGLTAKSLSFYDTNILRAALLMAVQVEEFKAEWLYGEDVTLYDAVIGICEISQCRFRFADFNKVQFRGRSLMSGTEFWASRFHGAIIHTLLRIQDPRFAFPPTTYHVRRTGGELRGEGEARRWWRGDMPPADFFGTTYTSSTWHEKRGEADELAGLIFDVAAAQPAKGGLPIFFFNEVGVLPDAAVELTGMNADLDMAPVVLLHSDVRRIAFKRVRWPRQGARRVVFEEAALGAKALPPVTPNREPVFGEDADLHHYRGDGAGAIPADYVGAAHVEGLYRDLRFSYEERMMFHEAGDFFVGEMEMRRRRASEAAGGVGRLRSLDYVAFSLYRAASLYGQSYARALGCTVAVVVAFALVFYGRDFATGRGVGGQLAALAAALAHSALAILHVDESGTLEKIEGLAGIFLLAVFFLAIRQRLMRFSSLSQ